MRVATGRGAGIEANMADEELPSLRPDALGRLLDALPTGVALQDTEGRILWANQALARQVGLPPEEIVGRTLSMLPLERVEREDGGPLYHLPRAVKGQTEWLLVNAVRLPENGASGLRVAIFEDVTQAERFRRQVDRLQQALHGQVSTDEVTGLLSQRGLMSQLEAQVSRSRRYNNVLSLAIMRLHCVGAQAELPSTQAVLSISRLLRDQTRWPDIIGRWNEEDFVLVLPETPESSAGILTEKLRQRIAEIYPPDGENGANCLVAFSVVEWQKGDSAHGLLERAAAGLP